MPKVEFVFLSKDYSGYLSRHVCSYAPKSSDMYDRLYLKLPGDFNGYTYCIPFSSGKERDYIIGEDGIPVPRSDNLTTVRLIDRNVKTGRLEVKSALQITRMVPAPSSEIIPFEKSDPKFSKNYDVLVKKESACVREKLFNIQEKADLVYRATTRSDSKYRKIRDKMRGWNSVDFLKAESSCLEFARLIKQERSGSEIFASVAHLPEVSGRGTKCADSGESKAAAEEQGAVGGIDLPQLQSKPKPQPKQLSLPPGSAWNKPLKISSDAKPTIVTMSAWDKPLVVGQVSYATIASSMSGLSLTDGAVGGAKPKRTDEGSRGSVRASVLDARGRIVSQNGEQGASQGRGRGSGRVRGRGKPHVR